MIKKALSIINQDMFEKLKQSILIEILILIVVIIGFDLTGIISINWHTLI